MKSRCCVIIIAFALAATAQTSTTAAPCPTLGWQENLASLQTPAAAFPIAAPSSDCAFHQWSWEAFIWATALDVAGVPRFMGLPTPDELLSTSANAGQPRARRLALGARSLVPHGTPGFTEGTGAFVQADGNVLVAPNGYPVYASVHMNPSYFDTAKRNLIVNGGYTSQPADSSFAVGAAVFKATWLRLDAGQPPPAGAYTTQAQVPVLTEQKTASTMSIVPVPGQFTTVTVALVGLHVGGFATDHPEFVWGTFEHRLNAPAIPDNTFTTGASNPNNFTFYKANTSFAEVNQRSLPPALIFNASTQRFSPVTSVVLENKTGGENQPDGAANVAATNVSGQAFLTGLKPAQAAFSRYNLIGTVWMAPNTYNTSSTQTNAVGSVNLANATAETFFQAAKNTPTSGIANCFTCHNATSYSFQSSPPPLINRRIALSHVLAVGTPYAVQNRIVRTIDK